jgi:hypothetical protein
LEVAMKKLFGRLFGFARANKVLVALVAIPLLMGAGATAVHEIGYSPRMEQCIDITCGVYGDGGTLTQTTGAVYRDAGLAIVCGAVDAGALNGTDAGCAVQYTDAGLLTQITKPLTAGERYELTVSADTSVRLRNGGAAVTWTSGPGQIENEGTDKIWYPRAAPDGGVPNYSCASKSGTGYVNVCPAE